MTDVLTGKLLEMIAAAENWTVKLQEGKPEAAGSEAVHLRDVETGKKLEVCAAAGN